MRGSCSVEAKTPVSVTVDVEDWYEGMAALGHAIARPEACRSGLEGLHAILTQAQHANCRVTLFVVSTYARTVRSELEALAAAGHEIASHGADHGRLATERAALGSWLKRGREELEDVLGVAVTGFRAPRFDAPVPLDEWRELIAEAGYRYVSDRSVLGGRSPVREIPVLPGGRLRLGGGSYQRLVPYFLLDRAIYAGTPVRVLYYHSYDFGASLPTVRHQPSTAVAAQVWGRRRIPAMVERVLTEWGSVPCRDLFDDHRSALR